MRYWYSSGTVTGVTYAVTDHSIAAGATSFRDAKATASLTNFGFDAMNPPNYGTFGIPGFYINGNIAFWYQSFSIKNTLPVGTHSPGGTLDSSDAMFVVGPVAGYRPTFFPFVHAETFIRYDLVGGGLAYLSSPRPTNVSYDWGLAADATLFYTTLEWRYYNYTTAHYPGPNQPWQVLHGVNTMLSLRFDVAGLIIGLMQK